jgi:multisubunit Na+/H+ antiporter MnhC subunit
MIMITQSVLVLTAIVSVFATFGIVLAWADFYTQRRPMQDNDPSLSVQEHHQKPQGQKRAA